MTVKALFQRLLITKACALQDIVDISRTALFYFSYHLTRHYHSPLKQCRVVFLRSVMAVPVFLARSVIPSGEQWPRPCLDTHQLLLYQPVTHLTPTSLSLPQPYITVHKSALPPERYFNQNFSYVMLQNHRSRKNFFDSGVVVIK